MDTERWHQAKTLLDEALARPPAERAAFLAAATADEALRREVASLLACYEDDPTFLETSARDDVLQAVADADDRGGTRLGPYRLVREIGHGGMGAVYLAERVDGQFAHRVAVKIVAAGGLREDLQRRLRHERQILASLQHPHIARLLDGGVSDEGVPYLVMEYVDGVPIDVYCDRKRLTTTERLRLFRTVCAAVQEAHQNLIIHRDLKPSNILVTDEGRVKLLDFGIAKLLAEDPAAAPRTRTGMLALTPEYASPEQLRGGPVTTASDVYSLGVILYELLTGHRPYAVRGRSPAEVERIICEKAPARPSSVVLRAADAPRIGVARRTTPARLRRRLQGDLDTVVLKALHKEPGRRYRAVEPFSEDLRRHLARLPVHARPDTPGYRLSRFVRRHTVGVAATGLVLLSLVGGIIGTAYQARVAAAARDRAEARFNDVRTLANTLLFDFHDALRDLPGATPARRLLVANALTYLAILSRENRDDPALRAELAEAYQRVGEIQGDPHRPNLGDMDGATEHYRQAVALREVLWRQHPADPARRHALAEAYGRLAVVRSWSGDNDRAIALSRQALDLLAPLRDAEPDDARLAQDAGRLRSELGWWLVWAGRIDEAREHLRTAEADLAVLARRRPNDLDLLIDLFRTYNYQVDGFAFQGHADSALALLNDRAAPLIRRLEAGYPFNPRARGVITTFYSKRGSQYESLGHLAAALRDKQGALEHAERLVALDTTNWNGHQGLAMAFESRGRIQQKMGRLDEAAASLQRSLTIKERLYRRDGNGEAGNTLANTYRNLCALDLGAGRLHEALARCRQGLALQESVVRANPADAVWQDNLGVLMVMTAQVYRALARTASGPAAAAYRAQARDWFDRSIALFDTLKARGVGWPIDTDTLAAARDALR